MSFKEITHCVQRFEMLEEKAGIEIHGLMVTVDDDEDSDGEYSVHVLGEITAKNGTKIRNAVEIRISCYNAKGQLCGTTEKTIWPERFFGVDTLDHGIYARGFPVSMKIMPSVKP